MSREAIDVLNEIARDLGLGPSRNRHSMNLWSPPHDWKGRTRYYFGYTPWRTKDDATGKVGFFALKYRELKNGRIKLVKSVRFGKRRIAKKRAMQWYNQHYHRDTVEQIEQEEK